MSKDTLIGLLAGAVVIGLVVVFINKTGPIGGNTMFPGYPIIRPPQANQISPTTSKPPSGGSSGFGLGSGGSGIGNSAGTTRGSMTLGQTSGADYPYPFGQEANQPENINPDTGYPYDFVGPLPDSNIDPNTGYPYDFVGPLPADATYPSTEDALAAYYDYYGSGAGGADYNSGDYYSDGG